MLSLPIPYPFGPHRYSELASPSDRSYGAILRQLGWNTRRFRRGWRDGSAVCHLDPDLRPQTVPRHSRWRPTFGQVGNGQSQLTPYNLKPGDLFLFFGLFRHATWSRQKLRFCASSTPFHALYGWLRVGLIYTVNDEAARTQVLKQLPWLTGHPHVEDLPQWQTRIGPRGPNRLYVAVDAADGAGVLRYDDALRLTAPGLSASRWRMFDWCGAKRNSGFSRCKTAASWRDDHDPAYIDTHIGRWQEMVLSVDDYPDAVAWAGDLINSFGEPTVALG
jgi:hypothetical protein